MSNGSLSLVAVGDLVPSMRLFADGAVTPGWKATVDLIQKADIAFGDLEMPLTTGGYPREKGITFRASPAIAADLKKAGFHVLSLANNHSLDYDIEGMRDTIKALKEQGIRYVGAGENLSEAAGPVIVEASGCRIGFLAFSALLPVATAAGPERPGMAPLHVITAYEVNPFIEFEEPGNPPIVRTRVHPADLKFLQDAIAQLRQQVDFVALSLHIGFGAGETLAEYEQPLARACIDAGADIILGNHVHAIHGIEAYKGKAILYSPGNFIAQQPREGVSPEIIAVYDDMSKDGYLARIDIAPNGSYGVRIFPTMTNANGLPEVQLGAEGRRIAEHIRKLSARMNTEVRIEGDVVEVALQ